MVLHVQYQERMNHWQYESVISSWLLFKEVGMGLGTASQSVIEIYE